MWAETKRVPLVAGVKIEIESLAADMKAEGLEGDASLKARLQGLQRKMESRQKDERFHVTLQHIGSPEDPRRWYRMAAEYRKQLHNIRVEARKAVMRDGGAEDMEKAISAEVARSPELEDALSKYARDCLVNGLVDGENEYVRIYKLGGAKLILDALAEVRLFHEMDSELGEA